MTFEEFNRRFRKRLYDTARIMPSEITDEGIFKFYLSHSIIAEWQHKEMSKKGSRRERRYVQRKENPART